MATESVAQDILRAFVERIERMEEEKKAITDDIREIYAEAKGNGFDTKVLRKVIVIRKQDRSERLEQAAILELYLAALGMTTAPADDEEEDDPVLGAAIEAFRDNVDRLGGEVTIEVGGHEPVTIKPRPGRRRKPARSEDHDHGFDLGAGV